MSETVHQGCLTLHAVSGGWTTRATLVPWGSQGVHSPYALAVENRCGETVYKIRWNISFVAIGLDGKSSLGTFERGSIAALAPGDRCEVFAASLFFRCVHDVDGEARFQSAPAIIHVVATVQGWTSHMNLSYSSVTVYP